MCNESSCCAEKVLCIPVSSEKRWIKEEREESVPCLCKMNKEHVYIANKKEQVAIHRRCPSLPV